MIDLFATLLFIHRFEIFLLLVLVLNLSVFFTLMFTPAIYDKPTQWVKDFINSLWKRFFVKRP